MLRKEFLAGKPKDASKLRVGIVASRFNRDITDSMLTYHCIIALGCIIKGETKHDEYIAHAVAQGLMRVMLDTGVPVALGIITPNTLKQARLRSRGTTNHGASAARAALEMALAE
jgi:6,7-dimethyl-8-ribityllumazine synthase